MDLTEIKRDGMDRIHLDKIRDLPRALVNTAMDLLVPESVWKFLSGLATEGFSRRSQLHGVN
jgi:hypothetical protein